MPVVLLYITHHLKKHIGRIELNWTHGISERAEIEFKSNCPFDFSANIGFCNVVKLCRNMIAVKQNKPIIIRFV